jgi:hypothetical protein
MTQARIFAGIVFKKDGRWQQEAEEANSYFAASMPKSHK